MPLLLKSVEPARGGRWIADAFRLYARRPFSFMVMFVAFLLAALMLSLVPGVAGMLLQMMSVPLLSLGFMVASQSALLGGPVQPGQFVEPLRADPARRKSLLLLCGIYGTAAAAILYLCDAVSGHAMQRFMQLVGTEGASAELEALMAEPRVTLAVVLGLVLGSALSVPFWHAPALVHWGRQGVAQALFSSTLALWRNKGAFMLYALGWVGVVLGFSIAASLLVLGLSQALVSMLSLSAMLVFQTVFYVSLLFTFNDSFGGADG